MCPSRSPDFGMFEIRAMGNPKKQPETLKYELEITPLKNSTEQDWLSIIAAHPLS